MNHQKNLDKIVKIVLLLAKKSKKMKENANKKVENALYVKMEKEEMIVLNPVMKVVILVKIIVIKMMENAIVKKDILVISVMEYVMKIV